MPMGMSLFGGKGENMARIERSLDEKRRIGVPSDQSRIDVLERVVAKLLVLSNIPANDPARKELDDIKDKLDQLDIDHPGVKRI